MMASREKSTAAFPAVPPSLNHESFEMVEIHKPAAGAAPPDTAGNITPYLGLRSRLSQIPINRWTVLLILVLARLLISLATVNDNLASAKTQALAACTKVEDIGSAMASMPHYLSVGVNNLAADGISMAVNGLVDGLMLVLTGVEELLLFVINMYVGTYACLIAALIHGGLDISVSVVNGTVNVFNKGISAVTDEINDDVKDVTDAINSLMDKIKNAASFFGGTITTPVIDLSGPLKSLSGIHVDDTQFVGDIVKLNQTIPTFDQVENLTRSAISIPFNLVKNALNSSYAGYEFDKSVFPVARKEALTFCSDNSFINDFFDHLYSIAAKAKIVAIVVLIVLAILAAVVMGWWEIRRYRKMQRNAQLVTQHGWDPMDMVYIASRPITASAGIKVASRFSGKRELLVRWCIAYATSLPALFILSLAIAGFFSCFCQWILLRAIQAETPALANEVGNFANQVVTTLEDVSVRWANDTNGVIGHFNDEINNDILGYVVNATSAVNKTLNTFDDAMSTALNDVFGDTILANPIRDVVQCLIGNKIDAVEKGLTWVHDNAHVTFPTIPNDTFSAGAKDSITNDTDLTSFLSSPSSVTTDEITGAVQHVTDMLHSSIVQEALISGAIFLVYVIFVLGCIIRAMVGMIGRDPTRGEGGQRFYTGEGRAPLTPRRSPVVDNGTRFPQFGSAAPETALAEDYKARANQEDSIMQRQTVRGGKGLKSPGHWRSSSYGHFERDGN